MSIYRFSSIFFCWFHFNLDLQAHWSYFCRCVKDKPQRPKFLGHFRPLNESKFRFSNILLKSFYWINTSLALFVHQSYFQRFVQSGPQRPNFWAILGPKVSQNTCVWSLLQKIFTGFISVLLQMLIASI